MVGEEILAADRLWTLWKSPALRLQEIVRRLINQSFGGNFLHSTELSPVQRNGKIEKRSSHITLSAVYLYWQIGQSVRSRNLRRQATPPVVIHTESSEQQSGVSRVNKEIADLIARKDPVLNRVNKKSKQVVSKQKKNRMEAKMIKAAAKAVYIVCALSADGRTN